MRDELPPDPQDDARLDELERVFAGERDSTAIGETALSADLLAQARQLLAHRPRALTDPAPIQQRLSVSQNFAFTKRHMRPTRHWISNSVALAAGALACTLLGVGIAAYWRTARINGATTTYTTNNGQRANLTLADGTIVLLNVGSRLEVPQDFNEKNRTVRVSGEVYFNVVHHTRTPFVVDVNKVRAVVLGTEFGVRAYQKDTGAVMVRNGKVSIGGTVLGASDIGRIVTGAPMTVLHHQPVDAMLGFAHGRLVLMDVPLREAIPDLDRWYDANIQLSDPTLGEMPMHSTLPVGSVADLAQVLQTTFGVRVERDGRTLTIYPR